MVKDITQRVINSQRFGEKNMRKVIQEQMKFGEVAISDIAFDVRSRDEIPKLLMGLQAIYCNSDVRSQVFEVLVNLVPRGINPNKGRKGMDLWKILVFGTLRVCCNWDYDKLKEIADNHKTIRSMLGHSKMDEAFHYALQTLKDNVSLFTPEILDKINQIVVTYGHEIIGKKLDEKLSASCDSFVLETDVHYPTDINLLWDAMRKNILLIMALCDQLELRGWRKGGYHIKKVKRLFRKAQLMKRSNSKNEKKKAKRIELIIAAHLAYLDLASALVEKVKETLLGVSSTDILVEIKTKEIWRYIAHAERQIDQIKRRVAEGEKIPHNEKVFSIFEEHTEWISKGKAGVSQELGLKVCVVKDQFGFILHHRVMQNETDDKVAVPIIQETKNRFAKLGSCSFDKGFHSPENQIELRKLLDRVVLPRKGKLSAINREIESSEEFREARRKHSAVESSINALENHGLDRCRDHGINGFERYVGLAILGRNIQIAGHVLQQKELKRVQRSERKQKRRLMATA
jgi:transposase, IS5 family